MVDRRWQVEVDSATPVEWSHLLARFSDANLYQTWSYGGVRWGEKSLSHLVLKREGDVVAMAQLRIVCPTKFSFGIAYLRWGPIFEQSGRPLDPDIAIEMARALEDEYVRKRKLFLRIVPNAFLESPRAMALQSAFSQLVPETGPSAKSYRTFVVDLSPPLEMLRKKLDPKWRNKLSSAEKNGLRVRIGTGPDEYRVFCRLYYEMRGRKTFDSTVDIEEFGRIQEHLPELDRMKIFLCEQEGEPVASIVVSAMGNSAIYLLGATGNKGLNSKGSYLLQWHAVQWLKTAGIRWYDLGGIDPERNPGVFQFKCGLSGADLSHMSQLGGCDSIVSSTMVAVAESAQRLRASLGKLRFGSLFLRPRAENA